MAGVALKINISGKLEKEAREEGLLSGAFLRSAIQRELARRTAARRLARHGAKFRAAGMVPLTDEEVDAEVAEVRAARRGTRASRR